MRFCVTCDKCGEHIWVRGSDDPDTNSVDLNENDSAWDEACEHIKNGGPYTIGDSEADDPED